MTEPKRGRGRPTIAPDEKREVFSARIPTPLRVAVAAEAKRRGMTTTAATEEALTAWLAAES